ncbi:MAG: flagellar export chaperone FliS [Fimbriimonadaceae bacterium]|nr:flagellar export chaperone FliS [Fimbriimonadaceae bacterium]
MPNNAYLEQYRKSAVGGASPLQLVVMLYDGALRFMEAGRQAMLKKDLELQNDRLQRAQKIISELIATLDMEKGGEVAQNLLALYSFCYNRLVEANIEDRPEYIEHAQQVFSQLRESWAQLDALQKQGRLAGESESPVTAA